MSIKTALLRIHFQIFNFKTNPKSRLGFYFRRRQKYVENYYSKRKMLMSNHGRQADFVVFLVHRRKGKVCYRLPRIGGLDTETKWRASSRRPTDRGKLNSTFHDSQSLPDPLL